MNWEFGGEAVNEVIHRLVSTPEATDHDRRSFKKLLSFRETSSHVD